MPRYRKLARSFLFEESMRSELTLDQGVRLNPRAHRLEIAAVDGFYPTTPDLHARTRVIKPEAVRKWAGFYADVTLSSGGETDVRFRLNDGVTDRYWNAGASDWVPASPNNWNTEQEVADNIAKWPTQTMQVVINLQTANRLVTPYVQEIRLLYDTDINFLEDYLIRSLVQDMRDQLRPISKLFVASTGQTTVSLEQLDTPYDVIDVDAVYNDTLDPDHMAPLSGVSYDAGTKVATFPAQPSGDRLTLQFSWRPYVLMTESQDFTEIAKIPVIMIGAVQEENIRVIRNRPFVINKATGEGFSFEEGYQSDLHIPMSFITASARDLHVLEGEIDRFFSNNDSIRSRGQDVRFPILVNDYFYDATAASQKELFSGRLTVRIFNAVFYREDAKPITGVLRFSVSTQKAAT